MSDNITPSTGEALTATGRPFPIRATLSRCGHGNALVTLESHPFNGLEIRPHELRRMAAQLAALAGMTLQLPLEGKHFKPTQVEIGTNPCAITTNKLEG